jgi:putative cardiolipin synthase
MSGNVVNKSRWLVGLVGLLALLALAGCASLPSDYPRSISHAVTGTADTRLGRLAATVRARREATSGVHLLSRGLDAFSARLALIQLAERSLDVQTYIWRNDTTSRLLAAALLRAADRGVRVRLIVDDAGVPTDDTLMRVLDAHPAIELRLFNPVANRRARLLSALLDFDRSNRRMHNKSFTADNQATIVGGRNIGDEYFEARLDLEFDDLDVLAVGQAVSEVSASFDQYWNSEAAYPIQALGPGFGTTADIEQAAAALEHFADSRHGDAHAKAVRDNHLPRELADGTLAFTPAAVRVLADEPGKLDQERPDSATYLLTRMRPEFVALRREVIFISPYFVPGDGGLANLQRLRARGVRVRVVTNSLIATDVPAVHAGYARYRPALLAAGIELYEVKPTRQRRSAPAGLRGSSRASLHAKALVFDCRQLFVGSMNIDPRSIATNTELGLVIDAPELAQRMCDGVEQALPARAWRVERQAASEPGWELAWITVEDGREVRLDREPRAGIWRRLQTWLFSLVPIELL